METENNNNQTSIKDIVLHKIDTNEISMHSKKYFALRVIALVALVALVLIISASIFNFIFFSLRLSHQGNPFAGGSHGFGLFLEFFPWGLLLLDVIFVVLLEWLLRKFRFGYLTPSAYILIGLLLVVIGIGFGVDRGTPFNDRMLHQADMHRLPRPMNDFYRGFRPNPAQ